MIEGKDCEGKVPVVNYGGLPQFIGVKIIGAEPMDSDSFDRSMGRHLGDNESRNGYKVVYEDGYTSWSPKNVFEKAYRRTDGMSFGLAIEALKKGMKVARTGWNGKGVYLFLQSGYPVNGHLNSSDIDGPYPDTPGGDKNIPRHKGGQMLSHIVMKIAGDSHYWGEGYSDYVPWLSSQTDILSDDWQIVE